MLCPLLLIASQAAPLHQPLPQPVSRTTWPESVAHGISGLTAHGDLFLAVPERQRFLIPFKVDAKGISQQPTLPIIDVPEGLDLESVASMSKGRLAFGTEGKVGPRKRDPILIASFDGSGAKVESEIYFDYDPFGITAEGNRGVEGLCFADGRLIAAAEQVIEKNGARFAPVGSYDFKEQRWFHYRLRLSSDTGKISDLTCRKTDRAREVFAIERHYSVARLLRFTLPLLDTGGEIKPEMLMDLTELYPGSMPNLEGIAALPDGRLLMISDNDYAGSHGPTHLLLLTPSEPKKPRLVKPGAYVQ